MITYSFKITNVNRLLVYIDEDNNTFENLITKIHYNYIGIDSEDNTMAIYNSSVNLAKPKTNDYTIFSDLTESNLIEWINQLITTDELELMQTVIKNNIIDKQTKASSLPWES